MDQIKWLSYVIEMATANVKNGGGPFAAIIVKDEEIIGSGTNKDESANDSTAHA